MNKRLSNKISTLLTEGLVDHAIRELNLAGYDINSTGTSVQSDDDYANLIAKSVLELLAHFAEQGHSGFSAPCVIAIFDKLAAFKTLTPITSNPEEWQDVSKYGSPGDEPMWQNIRDSRNFSNDGGKTWWNVDDKTMQEAKQIVINTIILEHNKMTVRELIRESIKELLNENIKELDVNDVEEVIDMMNNQYFLYQSDFNGKRSYYLKLGTKVKEKIPVSPELFQKLYKLEIIYKDRNSGNFRPGKETLTGYNIYPKYSYKQGKYVKGTVTGQK